MLQIKRALIDAGVSQRAIAGDCGISDALLAQIINHGQWPRSIAAEPLQQKIRAAAIARGLIEVGDWFADEMAPTSCSSPAPAPGETPDDPGEGSPMLLGKRSMKRQAREAFGLTRDPFIDDVQSPGDVFTTPDVAYVRESMWTTAWLGGFLAVIGESGSGKTTLRRDLHDRIERDGKPIIAIEPYVLGMEDNDERGKTLKAAAIAEAIIAAVGGPGTSPRRTQEARSRQVHQLLAESHRTGKRHVLIIEEAHSLPIPTLKHLKRFYELEAGFAKLLSIILLGQTELAGKLSENRPEVREVVQRCEVVTLPPLDVRLEDYLRFKFARVGADIGEIFAPGAIDAIRAALWQRGDGRGRLVSAGGDSLAYPLAVGNFVTAALNMAAEIGSPAITPALVEAVKK